MNDVIKNMIDRRSIRKYRDEQIKDEQLEDILVAGEYAASGKGKQATLMVVVQDPETIALMSRLNAEILGADVDPFYGAPTVIVVFADSERPTCVEDGSLVIGNMMLAAASLDVDSCWIHRARQTFETEEGKALMDKWGIPESYVGVGNCILGYREGELPSPPPRKEGRIIRP